MKRLLPLLILPVLIAPLLLAEEEPHPISPEEASKQINKDCTVQMVVRSAGKSKTGEVMFLNSEADYRSAKNFTIMLGKEAVKKMQARKIDDPTVYYKDRTIRVTGKVKLFRSRPEIIVNDPSKILIVEK